LSMYKYMYSFSFLSQPSLHVFCLYLLSLTDHPCD
jgi:hypothetical protein